MSSDQERQETRWRKDKKTGERLSTSFNKNVEFGGKMCTEGVWTSTSPSCVTTCPSTSRLTCIPLVLTILKYWKVSEEVQWTQTEYSPFWTYTNKTALHVHASKQASLCVCVCVYTVCAYSTQEHRYYRLWAASRAHVITELWPCGQKCLFFKHRNVGVLYFWLGDCVCILTLKGCVLPNFFFRGFLA